MEIKKRSYMINAESKKGGKFKIPVIDVRDGEDERAYGKNMSYHSNRNRGSKFLKPSFGAGGGCYQNSHKEKF